MNEGWVWDDQFGWYYDEELAARQLEGETTAARVRTKSEGDGPDENAGRDSVSNSDDNSNGSGGSSSSSLTGDDGSAEAAGEAGSRGGRTRKKRRRNKRRRAPRVFPRSKVSTGYTTISRGAGHGAWRGGCGR